MDASNRFLILSLEGEGFAIPIASLLEITVPRNIQKDPKLSEVFEGKTAYRGKLIPVVNLKKVLKLAGRAGGGLIVIKSSKGPVGLLVDSSTELFESRDHPAAIPRGILNSSLQYYAGILKNRDGLVLLLNVEGLLP
jgi:chemotaxis signal transduction protein